MIRRKYISKAVRELRLSRPARYFTPEVEAVKILPDGREICSLSPEGRAEYKRRLEAMVTRQKGLCAICLKPFGVDRPATFDHENLRSGGHRNDAIEVDGAWTNAALCATCNFLKGSRRIPYRIQEER